MHSAREGKRLRCPHLSSLVSRPLDAEVAEVACVRALRWYQFFQVPILLRHPCFIGINCGVEEIRIVTHGADVADVVVTMFLLCYGF